MRDKGNIQDNFKRAITKEISKFKSNLNTKQINLQLDDGVLNIHTLKSTGQKGTSIVSNGDGSISWSNSISAKQRDVYLIQQDTEYKFNSETETELIFPLYRDGAFSLESNESPVSIDIRIYYKYINSTSHLPFYLSVKKNDEVVYTENFGDYDDYQKNQKLNESLVISASNQDTIKVFIKKKFNDEGDIVLLKNTFMTFEIL